MLCNTFDQVYSVEFELEVKGLPKMSIDVVMYCYEPSYKYWHCDIKSSIYPICESEIQSCTLQSSSVGVDIHDAYANCLETLKFDRVDHRLREHLKSCTELSIIIGEAFNTWKK
ncbi:MAG: hypothetical protein ACRCSY_06180 [Cetobacterium sp.]